MRGVQVMLCSALLFGLAYSVTDQEFKDLKDLVTKVHETQKKTIVSLARQVSQQQLYVEEMTRSSVDSGLKLIRLTKTGSKPYFSSSYVDNKIASIHDHSNYIRTAGMGELVAVLNGVEFRTRHNDYKLRMPHRTSSEYGATEDIPMPEVPPQVLAKPTVDEQIEEMREWFKAWKTGDHSKRDYRKYFRPNLCYLEGQWTNAKGDTLDEPFSSDRHAIDAKNFFDLQTKIRYASVTGRKSTKENYAYLPTTIAEVDDDGNIVYSQWNYQILCHPLKNFDIPLSRFYLENDLGSRVANGKTIDGYSNTRSARFSLYADPAEKDFFKMKDSVTRASTGSYLDKLMMEIPGKDNYKAKVYDDGFESLAYASDANLPRYPNENTTLPDPLNAGFYHNAYKVIGNDAMGVSIRRRGFSDNNLYVAYNTQPKVTAVKAEGKKCTSPKKCNKARRNSQRQCARSKDKTIAACAAAKVECPPRTCNVYTHRVSYAIPLEIIYTTPLQSWNPYKIKIYDSKNGPIAAAPGAPRRTGGLTNETAYLGASNGFYSITPVEFYGDAKTANRDPADTVRSRATGVLDPSGEIRGVVTSGISIHTRKIPGVGAMRIRYPIMPVVDSGSTIYKDVQALADMTLKKNKYLKLYPDARMENGTIEEVFTFEVSVATKTPPGVHTHTLDLTQSDIEMLKAGKTVTAVTTEVAGHDHEIELKFLKNNLVIFSCDGQRRRCWDGHAGRVECPDCRFGIMD